MRSHSLRLRTLCRCYKHCTQDWQYGVYGRDNRCYQHCPPVSHLRERTLSFQKTCPVGAVLRAVSEPGPCHLRWRTGL